jgi:OPA family glycerol-3-phosphate transporter-like MFS transporter
MQLIVVTLLIAYIITLYFKRNPLRHTKEFMWKRFLSWFPLGMTYGFLYMARYNIDSLATAQVITKAEKSFVSGWGFFAYAAALFVTGPLIDRIGGKKGMILASLGAAITNIVMGWILYLHLHGTAMNLVALLTICYTINMVFQSFGAISTIKVKSFWFHVRERGTFGAIFGTLISLGVYFAFDWCDAITKAVDVKLSSEPGQLRSLLSTLFGLEGATISAFWLIFFIPAGLLLVWALIDLILIKDTPDHAGFGKFETHDASHGDKHGFDTWAQTIRKVFSNRVLLMIGVIEFTSGILRDGTMKWYRLFVKDTGMGVEHINNNWGLYAAVTGIVGSFLAGWASDRFFHSRRAPVAAIMQVAMAIAAVIIMVSMSFSPLGVGVGALMIMMAVIGVHSIMSGTATADFGGRKGAATATGIADGFSKLGSSFQEFALGAILTADTWIRWPMFLLPFAVLGLFFAWRLRNELPEATRKYLSDVEKVNLKTPPAEPTSPAKPDVAIANQVG